MTRAAVRAVALVAALSTASCSWIVMSPAPDSPVRTEPTCSTTRLPAFLDLYFGIPFVAIGALILVIASEMDGDAEQDAIQIAGGVTLGFGALFTWSGFSGLRMARECRAAEDEFEHWVNNEQPVAPKRNPWEKRPVAPGSEGGMCARGDTCAAGLTCASGFCVRLAPAPGPTPTPTPTGTPPPGGGTPVPPPPY